MTMPGLISLWKAPTKKLARKFVKSGFHASDFKGGPGQFRDGKAYFAKGRRLAQTYAESFGGGVIEVQMHRDDYKLHFQRFEERYQGGDEIQVPIPRDFLSQFNTMTIRRIWHHG